MGKEIKGQSPILLRVPEKNGNGSRFVVVSKDNKRKEEQEQAREQARRLTTRKKNKS